MNVEALLTESERFRRAPSGPTAAPPRWSLTASAEGSPAHLYLYDAIGFPGIEAREVVEAVRANHARPLQVHLNSPGGDVFAGLAIHNTLRHHGAPVDVRVEGLAASIASVIAMSGSTLRMARASLLMMHEPRALVIGTGHDMRAMAGLLDKAAGVMADIYARRGVDRDAVRAWMHKETWWTAADALEAKLIDALDDAPLPEGAIKAMAAFDYSGFRAMPGTDRPADPPRPPRTRERARVLAHGFDLLMGRAVAALDTVEEIDAAAPFDPTKHPRHEKGKREGGRFRDADAGPETVTMRGEGDQIATEEVAALTRKNHFYRGMTPDEYEATVGLGRGIRSRQDYSVRDEGTSFSHLAEDAESYVNYGRDDPRRTGRPTYLVEVEGSEGINYDRRDGYYKAPQPIPQDRIRRVYEMRAEGNAIIGRLILPPDPVEDDPRAVFAFDPTKHPRHSKGVREGGRFRRKDESDTPTPTPITEGLSAEDYEGNTKRLDEKHQRLWRDGRWPGESWEADVAKAEADLRAEPLIHATSAEAAAMIATKDGELRSRAAMAEDIAEAEQELRDLIVTGYEDEFTGDESMPELLQKFERMGGTENMEPAEAEQFNGLLRIVRGSTFDADRAAGLDQYVFFHHGRTSEEYGSTKILVDNAVLTRDGMIATPADIVTYPGGRDYDDEGRFTERTTRAYRDEIVAGEANYYRAAAGQRAWRAAHKAEFVPSASMEVKVPARVGRDAIRGFVVSRPEEYDTLINAGISEDRVYYLPGDVSRYTDRFRQVMRHAQANGNFRDLPRYEDL